jgi:hypothetical protein
MQRRTFLEKAMWGSYVMGALAAVGLVSGCTDTPPEAPKPTAEQDKAAKDAQNKMKEFLSKKTAGGAQKKH